MGGLAVQAGRYQFCDFNGGLIYDTRMDGVQASYGKDVKLTVGAGKASDDYVENPEYKGSKADEMMYAQLGAKLGVVDAKVGYYKFDDVAKLDKVSVGKGDDEIWTVGLALPVAKDLKLSGTYLMSDYDENGVDDDGYVIGLDYKGAKAAEAGTWGLWAKYYDQAAGTYVAHTFEAKHDFAVDDEGFKGYGVGANYTFAKNIVGAVKYYDLEAKEGSKDEETLYAELNFMF